MTNKITIMDDESEDVKDERLGRSISASVRGEANPEEAEVRSADAAARLLIWLSPAFPVGSFAFSHGLEWAVHAGHVHDVATVISWLDALLEHGAPRNDAIFAIYAWRATTSRDAHGLREVNALALATAGSRERHLETTAQGNAFVAIIRQAWREPTFDWGVDALQGDVAYPVAVGLTCAAHGVSSRDMLRSYVLAQVQNLVSAIIRLSVIGHTDGQRAIAALLPGVGRLALSTEAATLDDIGGAAFQSDIASLRHETQYSRLFRS